MLGQRRLLRCGSPRSFVGRRGDVGWLEADLPKCREIMEPSADAEVARVVDGGLGAKGLSLLMVLLDLCVLVVDVERRHHAVGDDAGAETARGAPADLAVEDQADLSGRPISRLSRITSSKKMRPVTGRSSTWVSENSAWRMERS